jgi:tyrosine-protein phosphatase SIW14
MNRILFVLFLTFPISSFAMGKSADLPKFFEVVKEQVYRGGQPSQTGLEALAQMKIKTVLDLRDEDENQIRREGESVRQLGMGFISVPLSGILQPSEKDIDQIEKTLADPDLQPVFVHCHYGEDRTGLAVGLYRVLNQNFAPKDAYQEMLDHGFHSWLFGLKEYFEKATGYED